MPGYKKECTSPVTPAVLGLWKAAQSLHKQSRTVKLWVLLSSQSPALMLKASRWSRWFCPSTLSTASIPVTALGRTRGAYNGRFGNRLRQSLNSGLARLS